MTVMCLGASRTSKASEHKTIRSMGLGSFARAMNVNPDALMLNVATILGGIAGPNSCFPTLWDATPLPKVHLLFPSDDPSLVELIDCLTAPVGRLQKRLSQNMARHRPEVVDVLLKGVDPFACVKSHNRVAAEKTLQHVSSALLENSGLDTLESLRTDLAFDPVIQRAEALKHPRILLSKTPWSDLREDLPKCHLRHALLVAPILAKPDMEKLAGKGSVKPNEFRSLLTGSLGYHSDSDRKLDLPLEAWVIFGLNREERAGVAGGEVVEHLIWAERGKPTATNRADLDSSSFFECYQQGLEKLLALRRKGEAPMIDFESVEAAREFYRRLANYRSELEGIPAGATERFDPTRTLPQTLFWALQFLRESMQRSGSLSDSDLITTAFAAARRVREAHWKLLLGARGQGLAEERWRLAQEIARRLDRWLEDGKTPPTTREITRWFSRQKKERFIPVLDALVTAGVVKVGKDKRYALGKVEAESVKEKLVEMFSAT